MIPRSKTESKHAPTVPSNRTALIVDDNASNRRLLRAYLEQEKFKTVEAENGREALSTLRRRDIDIVITDLVMPVMDGLRLCYEIKKDPRLRNTPVVVCTSTLTTSLDKKTALEAGADAYLVRPLLADAIVDVVHRAMSAGRNSPAKRPRRPKDAIIRSYGERLVAKLEEKNAELEKQSLALQEEVRERKRAVEAHTAAENELRSLFAAMTDIVLVLDSAGRYLSIAPTNPRFLYRPSSDLLGKSIHDILPADDARIIQQYIDAAVRDQRPVHVEYRLTLGNEVVWFDGTVSPHGEGKILWIARDITQRKNAQQELVSAHRQLQSLFDNLEEAIFSVDPAANVMLEASPAHERIFGYPPARFFENPRLWYDVAHPDDRKMLDQSFVVLGSGRSVVLQYRITRLDRAERWVEVRIRPTLDQAGKLVRLDGIASDITERKHTDQELKKQTSYFRQLFESSPLGIALLDRFDCVVDLNRSFSEMFQYTFEDLKGKPLNDFIVPPDRSDEARALLEESHVRHVSKLETDRVRKDGARFNVHVVRYPIMIENRRVGVYAVYVDNTHRKKLEGQLRQAAKMESLGTLAGGIAHDFNNILGIILGHAGLLEEGKISADHQTASVQKIIRAVSRGSSLVKQLLTFARKSEVLLESVRLNDAVKEAANLLKETLPKSITITLDLANDLPSIVGDANQIHQILINLCVNARDAMPKGGTLALRTSLTEGHQIRSTFEETRDVPYALMEISDTGIGMDEWTRTRIFEPFFTTKELGKGTGLGLATVFGIVRSHDGFVDVESAKGVGTTFRIYMPVQQPTFEWHEARRVPLSDVQGGKESVLVVEDEELLASTVQATLESKGYAVQVAQDGDEGIRFYIERAKEIDLVITDMGMPKRDGKAVITTICDLNPSARIILASGYVDPSEKAELLSLGLVRFIQKPYDSITLLQAVREILDAPLQHSASSSPRPI